MISFFFSSLALFLKIKKMYVSVIECPVSVIQVGGLCKMPDTTIEMSPGRDCSIYYCSIVSKPNQK